jgi:uncharacterized membrane protein
MVHPFFIMNSAQKKKILVLLLFVGLLMTVSYFLYNMLVKPSPYYPQEQEQEQMQEQRDE